MRDYIGLVTALVGLIAALMLLVGNAANLFDQPQQLRVFLVIAYIIFSVGIVLFAFRSKQTPQVWRWASLAVLYFVTIPFFIWVGTWVNISPPPPIPVSSFPFEIAYAFDFEEAEDVADTSPWFSVSEAKNHKLVISDDPNFSHSGKKSLRQVLSIMEITEDDPDEYAGIGITEDVYPLLTSRTINAAEAWVLVPKSEQAQNSRLQAHITAYTPDQNGNLIALQGEVVDLVPGDWTSVLWAGTYTVEVDAESIPGEVEFEELTLASRDRNITLWYLTVWSEAPYSGSIYIDDIAMYSTAKSNN